MKPRKIILLAGIALLLCICIIQAVSSANDKVRIFEFSGEPDEIVLENADGTITLVKNGEEWFVGEEKYPAADSAVDDMINSLKSIKALDKVSSSGSDDALLRYELNEGKRKTVTARKEGKVLRALAVGKDATAGSQSYITIDGGKDVYLATGNLSSAFDKSVDELRSRAVLSLDKALISAVSISDSEGRSWSLARSGSGMDVNWSISGADIEVDPELAKNFLEGLGTFVSAKWHDRDEKLGGEKLVSAKITLSSPASKVISFELYKIPAASEDGNDIFWGTCSETPYTFELASYAAQKLIKNPEELAK